jgi:hypothetical protein
MLPIRILIVLTVLLFPSLALAAEPAPPDYLDLLRPIWEAISAGNWWMAGAAIIVVAGVLLSRFGQQLSSWFATGAGKAVIVLVTSFGTALYASLQAGAVGSLELLWAATRLAVEAAGIYSLIKALVLEPLLRWTTAPAPIRWFTKALAWVYDRIVPPQQPAPAPLPPATARTVAASEVLVRGAGEPTPLARASEVDALRNRYGNPDDPS